MVKINLQNTYFNDYIIIGCVQGNGFWSWIIRKFQKYPFTHVFSVLSSYAITTFDIKTHFFTGKIIEAYHKPILKGGRVYMKYINNYFNERPKDKLVMFLFIKVSEYQQLQYIKFLHNQLGKKYDFLGILGFIFKSSHIQDIKRWFCTELIGAALSYNKIYLFNKSPSKLSVKDFTISLIKKAEHVIVIRNPKYTTTK